MSSDGTEKLQKVLAEKGLGSRRQIERWIAAGRVHVNKEVAHLGQRISDDDEVEVNGQRVLRLAPKREVRILVMNKAVGEVVTRNDPERRRTVFKKLPPLQDERWISVGRLDIATSGLLLFTNQGKLANLLMHPSSNIDREYAVRVRGRLSEENQQTLLNGVEVDRVSCQFSDIQYFDGSGSNHWYHVAVMEGRNREVRRLFSFVGHEVSRLKRVRYGPVILPSTIAEGHFQEMSFKDVQAICDWLEVPVGPRPKQKVENRKTWLIEFPGVRLPTK